MYHYHGSSADISRLSDNPVPRWQLIFYILGEIEPYTFKLVCR